LNKVGYSTVSSSKISLQPIDNKFFYPNLIEVLSQLDINDEIPPDLYLVVAELLAFVYSLNRNMSSI